MTTRAAAEAAIAKNISRIMDEKGLSANAVSRLSGVSVGSVLRARNTGVSFAKTLYAIAKALDTTTEALKHPGDADFTTGAGDEVSIKMIAAPKPRRLLAKGDALAPEIRDGDSLSTEDVSSLDEVKSGAFVVAIPKGSDTPVVRKLIKGDTACYLTVTNPDWPDKTPLEAEKILSVVTSRTTYFK